MLDASRDQGLYAGWIFAVINIDAEMVGDRVERLNITLPRRVLRRLDAAAEAASESRSGFIATMTLLRAELPTPRRKIKSGEPRLVGRRARQVPPVKGKPRG